MNIGIKHCKLICCIYFYKNIILTNDEGIYYIINEYTNFIIQYMFWYIYYIANKQNIY